MKYIITRNYIKLNMKGTCRFRINIPIYTKFSYYVTYVRQQNFNVLILIKYYVY